MSRLDRESDGWWSARRRVATGAEVSAGAGVASPSAGPPGRDGDTPDETNHLLTDAASDLLGRSQHKVAAAHSLRLAGPGITDVGFLRMVLASYNDDDIIQLTGELRAL